jgi:MFS family permease
MMLIAGTVGKIKNKGVRFMTNKNKKWLILLVICLGGGIVYILPYIQYSFYNDLQQAFGIDNVQMGNLMSVLGIVSTFAYLFGGILADKFNVKWLISISLAVTGLAGIWFSTFPSYSQLLIIMVIYGISTILTYWPAMIKAVKLLGSDDEQGKMFGFREAGFGLFALIFSQVGIWLIYNASPDINGIKNLIFYYSIIYIVTAVLSFIFIPNSSKSDKEKVSAKELLDGIIYVGKIPVVWLIGLSIFCAYCISGPGLGKLVPYWTTVMGLDSSVAASLSSLRLYLLPFLAAPLGGFLVDKMKSSTKFLNIAYILLTISLLAFVLIPGAKNMAIMAIILGFIASFVIYTMRGTYFVPMSESNIPNKYIGTAAGIISFIGFLPDAFMFTVFGKMMGDAPGESEFKSIFYGCIALALVGLVINKAAQVLLAKRAEKVGQNQ